MGAKMQNPITKSPSTSRSKHPLTPLAALPPKFAVALSMGGRPTRLQSVSSVLTELAHALGPGEKLPTVIQLRDSLGVSVTTLNSALGELEAKGVISRRHGVGIFVAETLHQRNVILLCDHSFFGAGSVGTGSEGSPFWGMLISQARRRAEAHNETVELHFASLQSNDPLVPDGTLPVSETLASIVQSGRIHGVLAVGVGQAAIDWLEAQSVPTVSFAGAGPYQVEMDFPGMIVLATRALCEAGCKRIALWSPVAPHRANGGCPYANDGTRLRVFVDVLAEYGVPFDPALVRDNRDLVAGPDAVTSKSHQEQGFRTACDVFCETTNPARLPDGVVSTDDMMTRGALAAFARQGLRAGRDIQIATHANTGSEALLGYSEDLTLVEFDPAQIVDAMFALLETRMDGHNPATGRVSVAPNAARLPLSTSMF